MMKDFVCHADRALQTPLAIPATRGTRSWTRSGLAALAMSLFVVCGPALASSGPAAWTGTVTYVVDGDTVRVRPPGGGKPVSVRVYGIDAPEICQAGGEASRDALARRVLGRQVAVIGKHRDDYGRLLAQLREGGEDLGGWMVGHGQAWSHRFRRDAGPYGNEQALAQAGRRGLFAGGGAALYPADFRKQHGPCRHSAVGAASHKR